MRVRRILRFVEPDVTHDIIATITHDKQYVNSWSLGTVKLSDVLHYNQWTITVGLNLCAALDQKGNSILSRLCGDGIEVMFIRTCCHR